MTTITDLYSVNYSEKNYNELFKEYVQLASQEGLISSERDYLERVYKGDIGVMGNVMLLEFAIHSKILEETYKDLTRIYTNMDLSKATDKNLDVLLEPYISRHPAHHSHIELHIKRSTEHKDAIRIGEGTIFEAQNPSGLQFQTLEDHTIPQNVEEGMVTVECILPGLVGNIPPTKFKKPNIEGIKEAYSTITGIGGCETEDDESYRQRAQKWKHINTKGTLSSVEDAIDSVGGVKGYYIEDLWDGPGTTRITIDTHDKKVLEDVKNAVDKVISLDLDITYEYAAMKPLELDLKVSIEFNPIAHNNMETEIEEVLKVYVEGGNNPDMSINDGLGLGEDFIPSRAIAYLINNIPELDNVEITKPASKIRIPPSQKAMIKKIQIKSITL